jgi:APA family basic amino acid/polyamine antiporter
MSKPTPALGLEDKPGLIRGIRRWDLVAVAINGIIGAGIFGIPSEVFKTIGVYSIAAFVVCAVVVSLIILCFAEVGSRFEATGGPYLYAGEAFGELTGFTVGWLLWLARLTAFAANLNLLVSYLVYFWPNAGSTLWRPVVITTTVLLLTSVNIIGVRDTARLSNVFTIGKLIPIGLFIVAGIFFLSPASYSPGSPPSFGSFSSAVLILIYAFTGFEIAVIPAGEVESPRQNLPMAILTALAVVAVVYILIQIVCVGTLPDLATSNRPLTDASISFLGRTGAVVMTVGALVSIVGNLNVLILAASRLPFAMGERYELPTILARTHPRFKTPYISIVLSSAVMLVATLSGTFVYALSISVIARLLAYASTVVALISFRRNPSSPKQFFNLRGGVPIAVVALLLIAWLLANTQAAQARDAAIAAGIGLALHLSYRRFR